MRIGYSVERRPNKCVEAGLAQCMEAEQKQCKKYLELTGGRNS